MSPGEPNPRDLGLLRDKVRYCRPITKAENIIKNEGIAAHIDDNLGGGDQIIPNTPSGTTTTAEYKAVQVLQDGISYLFGKDGFRELCAEATDVTPIGFQLLRYRSRTGTDGQQGYDYSTEHQPRLEVANKLDSLLRDGTRQRGWSKSTVAMKLSDKTDLSRKRSTSASSADEPPRKKRKSLYCCVCNVSNRESPLSRVPNYPPAISDTATKKKRIMHRKKCFRRREWMDRLGYGRLSRKENLRICPKHPKELVVGKSVDIEIDGKRVYVPVEPFEAPVSVAEGSFFASPGTVPSNGTGTDREILRHVINISREEATLSATTRVAIAKEALVVDKENVPNESSGDSDGQEENLAAWRKPRITIEMLTADEVKRRTGFRDLKHLLCYAAIIYGGNVDELTKSKTKMTWLEELVLYFEFSWGRTKIRVKDYMKEYDCSDKVLRNAITCRARAELDCRGRWPMYASYEEDAKFRDAGWNDHFNPNNGHRVIMHDTTNIPLPDPSSGDLNRALHNVYYNQCCAKAGVAVQLCSWIFGLPLVTGHSDEDRQIEDTKILAQQKEFSDNDKTSDRPFLNVLDKGYHQRLETDKHGQMCCQPDKADETFGGDKVIRSGCIAVIRSGNERGVNRCKMSWFIKRGCYDQLWDTDLLCDIWEAFTFRVNFMFDKFH
jgi:hypothetical protein